MAVGLMSGGSKKKSRWKAASPGAATYINPNIPRLPGPTRPSGIDWYRNPNGPAPAPKVPTFEELLAADQIYQQTYKMLAAQGVEDKEARNLAWQRAFINFGEVPTDTSFMPGGALSVGQGVRDLAAAKTREGLSIVARLNKAYSDRQRGITNNLAARGIIGSGETGFQYGENALMNKQNQFDARESLVDQLGAVNASFIQAERARQAALLAAAQSVVDRHKDDEPPPPPGKNTGQTVYSPVGQPLWRTGFSFR